MLAFPNGCPARGTSASRNRFSLKDGNPFRQIAQRRLIQSLAGGRRIAASQWLSNFHHAEIADFRQDILDALLLVANPMERFRMFLLLSFALFCDVPVNLRVYIAPLGERDIQKTVIEAFRLKDVFCNGLGFGGHAAVSGKSASTVTPVALLIESANGSEGVTCVRRIFVIIQRSHFTIAARAASVVFVSFMCSASVFMPPNVNVMNVNVKHNVNVNA